MCLCSYNRDNANAFDALRIYGWTADEFSVLGCEDVLGFSLAFSKSRFRNVCATFQGAGDA